jgi:SAM-dependent methyltransferase
MWDTRYSSQDYVYGTEPNAFLAEVGGRIAPRGRVLSLAEGEGRNAVYLATMGYQVTGVDSSRVGLEKAQRLAAQHSVGITTVVADLAEFPIEPGSWDGIISIFCHLPSHVRAAVHRRVVAGLRPGGVFILEAYTPRQLTFKTGGPSQIDALADLATLRRELAGLRLVRAAELERDVFEGQGHFGRSAVVQILGIKEK